MLSTISKITKKNKMLKKSRKHIIIKRKKHNFQPHTTLTFLTFITLFTFPKNGKTSVFSRCFIFGGLTKHRTTHIKRCHSLVL